MQGFVYDYIGLCGVLVRFVMGYQPYQVFFVLPNRDLEAQLGPSRLVLFWHHKRNR